jgi:hypothetical protein
MEFAVGNSSCASLASRKRQQSGRTPGTSTAASPITTITGCKVKGSSTVLLLVLVLVLPVRAYAAVAAGIVLPVVCTSSSTTKC